MEDITKIFDEMKISRLFILVDSTGIIQCVATERENLHQDKITAGMKEYELTDEVYGEQLNEVFPGDEYDATTGQITSRPENHAPLPEEMLNRAKIQNELELMAAERLIQRGELPSDYITKILSKWEK